MLVLFFWELSANAACWSFELKVFAAKSLLIVQKPQFPFRKHSNYHTNYMKLENPSDLEVRFIYSLQGKFFSPSPPSLPSSFLSLP